MRVPFPRVPSEGRRLRRAPSRPSGWAALALAWLVACGEDHAASGAKAKNPAPRPAATPAAEVKPESPVEDAPTIMLPVPERTCAVDADCIGVYALYEREGACCHSCETDAVNRESAIQQQEVCGEMGSEGCPVKKCAAKKWVRCVDGGCAVAGSSGR